MQVTTIGIDLAKNILQVHGIAENGDVVFNRAIRRAQLLAFFEDLPACLVGMEACSSSHYWARQLSALGHDVRLIPANCVKPYVKRGKTDAADAEAICEAVKRPTMRFVAIKTEEQQSVLFLHRARDLIVRQRTQISNMLRGLLAEFGIVIAQGIGSAVKFAKDVLDNDRPDIPEVAVDVLTNLSNQLVALHLRIRWYEMRMRLQAKQGPRVALLRTIPGVGPVTASAIAATIGDARQFKNGREFAAWLGLTPLNRSSGGKERLGRPDEERILPPTLRLKQRNKNTETARPTSCWRTVSPVTKTPNRMSGTQRCPRTCMGLGLRKPSGPADTCAAQTGRTHVCF